MPSYDQTACLICYQWSKPKWQST